MLVARRITGARYNLGKKKAGPDFVFENGFTPPIEHKTSILLGLDYILNIEPRPKSDERDLAQCLGKA